MIFFSCYPYCWQSKTELFFCLFIGPAESLFKESYYQLMKAALRNGGILCSQGNLVFSVCRRVIFVLKVR